MRYNFTLLLLLCLITYKAHATNYYLSNTGNDANSGTTTAQAWQTIAKLNQNIALLSPGDSVLFKRGDSFLGSIVVDDPIGGTAGNPIVFGAYGSGDNPIIRGDSLINSGWTVHSGNIYKVTTHHHVEQLWLGNTFQARARIPNSGFYTIDTATASYINDNAINQATNYWKGAKVVTRTTNWTYERQPITASDADTIWFAPMHYEPQKGWGFFIDSKLELLDTQTEWFYDSTSQTLYYYAPGGANPNTLNVYASVYDKGLSLLRTNNVYIDVCNLDFTGFYETGIFTGDIVDAYNNFKNNNFYKIGGSYNGTGIEFAGNYTNLSNNTFYNLLGRGIHTSRANNVTIQQNDFNLIGLYPGFGVNGLTMMVAISTIGGAELSNYRITQNTIDSTGYNGINFYGSNSLIDRNILTNTVLRLKDAAAINTWNGNGGFGRINNVYRRNIIMGVYNNHDATPYTNNMGEGFYLDDKSRLNTFDSNTVINVASASIKLHNCYENTITNNVFYDFREEGILFAEDYNWPEGDMYDNSFDNNVVVALEKDLPLIKVSSKYHFRRWRHMVNASDNNQYVAPASHFLMNEYGGQDTFLVAADIWDQYPGAVYDLEMMQRNTGMEANSFFIDYMPAYDVVNETTIDLAQNGNFNSSLTGWSSWSGTAPSPTRSAVSEPKIGGTSGQCDYTGLGYAIFYNRLDSSGSTGYYRPDSFYVARISVLADSASGFRFIPQGNGDPGYFMYSQSSRWFPADSVVKSFEFVFNVPELTPPGASGRFNIWAYKNNFPLTVDSLQIKLAQVSGFKSYAERFPIFVNTSDKDSTFSLGSSVYTSLDSNTTYSGTVTVPPYYAMVLRYSHELSPLSIETIVYFVANAQNENKNMLQWQYKGQQCQYFELQLVKPNQQTELLTRIPYSTDGQYTHTLANSNLQNDTYYKLLAKDADGNIIDHASAFLQNSPSEITVYPNPTNGVAYLKGLDQGAKILLSVYAANGQNVSNQVKVYNNGTIHATALRAGLYYIIAKVNQKQIRLSLLKE